MTNKIIFGIGSNLGDRQSFLQNSIIELETRLDLKNIKKSKIIQNKALLLENSPAEWNIDFLNIVISGDIELPKYQALEILKIIKEIETDLGRIDRGRWSPREIDIDILAIDNLKFNIKNKLHIPHPELLNRDFFINSFNEIEPEILQKIRHD